MGGLHQIKETDKWHETGNLKLREQTTSSTNSMLHKEVRSVVINKRLAQKSHILVDVLPTTPGTSTS